MSDLALGHLSSQAAEGVSPALCLTKKSDLKVSRDRVNETAMGDMAVGYLSSQAAEGMFPALNLTKNFDLARSLWGLCGLGDMALGHRLPV